MKLIHAYINTINRNCLGNSKMYRGLEFWQNLLFARILAILLPLSLISLIPGIILSIKVGNHYIGYVDEFVFFGFIFIAFKKNMNINIRKIIFVSLFYLISTVLLYYLGSFGPGLLLILGISVIIIIIFPAHYAYTTVVINLVICLIFGLLIYLKLTPGIGIIGYNLASWIAISSNLIMLCALLAALLPTILSGLQKTIQEQESLKLELRVEKRNLLNALEGIKNKNHELEQFAYMASHDLQEPLRMVTSFLGMIESSYATKLDEKGLQYIHYASDGATRMKKIIEDLLEYSVAGNKELNLQDIDLNQLMIDFVKTNRTLIEEKNSQLNWQNLPVIKADPTFMLQLFQNLIGNALKYQSNDAKPVVTVSARELKNYWEISVADNGIGIEKEYFERIFAVFQRLHDKRTYKGTGIGLAICKKIVELHKGKIWVESTPGQGSNFKFTIIK